MEKPAVNEKALRKLAKTSLGARRFTHVENVVEMADTLAVRFGADVQKARAAAWLHDIAKEKPREEMLEILQMDAAVSADVQKRPFPVWHGIVAAVYAREKLGINDEDLLQAVANHTTGRANMTVLEKVVYLADMISAERHYDDVGHIRLLAEKDLDEAVYASLVQNAAHVRSKAYEMDAETLNALAWYEDKRASKA